MTLVAMWANTVGLALAADGIKPAPLDIQNQPSCTSRPPEALHKGAAPLKPTLNPKP